MYTICATIHKKEDLLTNCYNLNLTEFNDAIPRDSVALC